MFRTPNIPTSLPLFIAVLCLAISGCSRTQDEAAKLSVEWKPLKVDREDGTLTIPCQVTNTSNVAVTITGLSRYRFTRAEPRVLATWDNGSQGTGIGRGGGSLSTHHSEMTLDPGEHKVHTYRIRDYTRYLDLTFSISARANDIGTSIPVAPIEVAISHP